MSGVDTRSGNMVDDNAAVLAHLRRRGVAVGEAPLVEWLSGGVSNDVLAVGGPDDGVVVKRALHKLRVAEDWQADPDRVLTEATALQAAARFQPDHVPPVLDVDREERIIVIGRAEAGAHEWKADLLAGSVDRVVAAQLGGILACWHRQTAGRPDIAETFADMEPFDQLRVDPFHRNISRRHPDLAPAIDAVVAQMAETRECLVHGDFSPKNVLLGPRTTWIIDWEVAHYGDPTFDLAFLVSHLLCKALRSAADVEALQAASEFFLAAYAEGIAGAPLSVEADHVAQQTACLLLARMDGKSPVPYLDESARDRGRRLARSAIGAGMTLDDFWKELQ